MIAGLGVGLVNPTGSSLALDALPMEQSGLASGANDTFRQTGVAVGIAWLGTFVPVGIPFTERAKQEFVDGVHNALVGGSILALVCAAGTAFLLLGRTPDVEGEGETDPAVTAEPV
jgi:MFS family permease